jgi:hypothetical protein
MSDRDAERDIIGIRPDLHLVLGFIDGHGRGIQEAWTTEEWGSIASGPAVSARAGGVEHS